MQQFSSKRVIPVITLRLRSSGKTDSVNFGFHRGNITIANALQDFGIEQNACCVADCAGKYDCEGVLSIVQNAEGLIDLVCQKCGLCVPLKMKPTVASLQWLRLSAIISQVKFNTDSVCHPAMKAQRIVHCSDDLKDFLGVSHVIYFTPGFAIAGVIGDRIPADICNKRFPGVVTFPENEIALIEKSFK